MAVTVLLDFTFRPDQLASAEEFVAEMLVATRGFAGCTEIEVTRDITDPARFVLIETWESVEHDDAYRAWRATPAGNSGLRDRLATPPALTRLETVASF
jgi:heme oxygenase (mycobilin-producing)